MVEAIRPASASLVNVFFMKVPLLIDAAGSHAGGWRLEGLPLSGTDRAPERARCNIRRLT
ncbi:hypothetical protein [Qipengyuania citrea]|uniref:hypothetical protein n=1 Tax=Qipengyuania citrea TaxID=225971 RepID=UPI00326554E8